MSDQPRLREHWRCNRISIIQQVSKPSSSLASSSTTSRTPSNTRQLRIFRRRYEQSPSPARQNQLFKFAESESTRAEILQHENRGLRWAL